MRFNEKWHRMLFACNGNKLSDRILGSVVNPSCWTKEKVNDE